MQKIKGARLWLRHAPFKVIYRILLIIYYIQQSIVFILIYKTAIYTKRSLFCKFSKPINIHTTLPVSKNMRLLTMIPCQIIG